LTADQRLLTLAGSLTQTASGNLSLAIGGTTAGVNHDTITAAGPVVLDGTLTLNFTGTFAPGQKLVLIRSVAGISGKFSAINGNGVAVTGQLDGQTYVITVS
jgi:hypothetical protein